MSTPVISSAAETIRDALGTVLDTATQVDVFDDPDTPGLEYRSAKGSIRFLIMLQPNGTYQLRAFSTEGRSLYSRDGIALTELRNAASVAFFSLDA